MKRLQWICLSISCLFAAAGCQTNQIGNRFAKEDIRVVLTGTPGLAYSASYRVDGILEKAEGTVPDEIIAQAGSFFCEARKGEAEGELNLEIFLNGESMGTAATTKPLGSVRVYRNYITWTGKLLNSISGF